MIDVSELRRLVANELHRLTDIEPIFDALVAYPEGEGFHNATRADLSAALAAACASLVGDPARMPDTTRLTILSVAAAAQSDLPAGDGTTYGWGAAAVDEAITAFEGRLHSPPPDAKDEGEHAQL
jgi:hypothetical protein